MSCTNSKFPTCLHRFLNQSGNIPFRQDVRFDEKSPSSLVYASRYHVKMALEKSLRNNAGSAEKMRNDLQSSLRPKPIFNSFFEIEDLFVLQKETVIILIIATVVVFWDLSSLQFKFEDQYLLGAIIWPTLVGGSSYYGSVVSSTESPHLHFFISDSCLSA